jgi:5-formyltetrahydrofolate cyclo-ligase
MAEDAIIPGDGNAAGELPGASRAATPAAAAKRQLRAHLRAARKALPAADRMRAAEAIVAPLLALPELQSPGYVAGYWAMDGEVPLHVLQLRLPAHSRWCLPCIQADGSLRFAPWRPGDPLVSNRFGIPEPDLDPASQLDAADMAVILLPLVGFDRAGHRLGMGGGFYDRSLAFRTARPAPPPRLVGVAYAAQETAALPDDAWDVPLDAIVTEQGRIDPANGGR